jgi:hypothetical protein
MGCTNAFVRRLGLLALALCAACGSTMPFTMPEQRHAPERPGKTPAVSEAVPHLVAYPGIEVSYVANADGDVYRYRDLYYTYFDGSWFCAQALRGPWNYIEMKYVPSDLFRVRGHRPPSLR